MRRAYVLFFVSGIAGLVYQVVWSRLLHEVFGVTVYAVTAVLATFLLGLAAGGYALGRLADRSAYPLRVYGWLEIGVGATALVGLALLGPLDRVHVAIAGRLAPDSIALLLVRIGLAAIVVLPPTFLMGGTFPAIARAVVRRIGSVGREIGTLYALNTAGAVLGTLLAGFWLIRTAGLRVTLGLAVLSNVIVGIVALLGAERAAAPSGEPTRGNPDPGAPATAGRSLLVVMALSGFVTLGLEVLWTRVLVMSVGTTAYSFVTMLSAFLVGLALGGWLVRPWIDRVSDLRRAFGRLELGIAASTVITLPLLASGTTQEWLAGRGGSWTELLALRFGVSLLVMLAPAMLIGATFPIAARIWMHDLGRVGTDLGRLYGANTLGNILGAALTGFVVLPVAGLQRGIVILTALSVLCAAWGFLGGTGARRLLPAWLGAAVCVALLLTWRPAPFRAFGEEGADETLFYREDVIATVKVLRKAAAPDELWMTIDSIRIGQSLGGVDAKQQALAHLPFLLRPDAPPRRVLVIGLGTGILAGEAARHPSVERIDALEISPGVIDGAHAFAAWNHGALDDPRIRVVNDDGVNFLRRSPETYDLVVEDAKSRTAHAANSLFFSREFYELCRAHLGAHGLFLQWVPLESPPRELRTIVRTLRLTFDHVYVIVSAPHALFLAASDRPLVLDASHIDRLLGGPAAGLGRYGLRSATDVLKLLTTAGDGLAPWLSREATVNTLDRPVLEFYALRDHAVPPSERADENCAGLVCASPWPSTTASIGPDPETRRDLADAARALETEDPGGVARAVDRLRAALVREPQDPVLVHAMTAIARRTVGRAPQDGEARLVLAEILGVRGAFDEARSELRHAERSLPGDARVRRGLAALDQLSRRANPAPSGPAEP